MSIRTWAQTRPRLSGPVGVSAPRIVPRTMPLMSGREEGVQVGGWALNKASSMVAAPPLPTGDQEPSSFAIGQRPCFRLLFFPTILACGGVDGCTRQCARPPERGACRLSPPTGSRMRGPFAEDAERESGSCRRCRRQDFFFFLPSVNQPGTAAEHPSLRIVAVRIGRAPKGGRRRRFSFVPCRALFLLISRRRHSLPFISCHGTWGGGPFLPAPSRFLVSFSHIPSPVLSA